MGLQRGEGYNGVFKADTWPETGQISEYLEEKMTEPSNFWEICALTERANFRARQKKLGCTLHVYPGAPLGIIN